MKAPPPIEIPYATWERLWEALQPRKPAKPLREQLAELMSRGGR